MIPFLFVKWYRWRNFYWRCTGHQWWQRRQRCRRIWVWVEYECKWNWMLHIGWFHHRWRKCIERIPQEILKAEACGSMEVIGKIYVENSGGQGRIKDTLPVREVVGELTVRYQIIIKYKSYFYRFQQNTLPRKRFSTKWFPRNAGKVRWGKIKEA